MKRAVISVALLLAIGACACESLRGSGAPNVLLIVVDTLRADHLGSYGYTRPTSPNIDAFAQRGTRFTDARATSSWTLPSVVSIFTGLHPAEHGVERSNTVLPAEMFTLAEAFHAAGYETAAFSANPAFVTAAQGIEQGFDRFKVLHGPTVERDAIEATPGDPRFQHSVSAANGDVVTDAVLEWLAARPDRTRPSFVYAHYYDPHAAYTPPADLARRFGVEPTDPITGPAQWPIVLAPEKPDDETLAKLVSLYDAEIAFVDAAIGRLLSAANVGDDRSLLTILTSDHGEEFGDHGGLQHGRTLFDELLRVPLIVVGPHAPAGSVVSTPVSLVSIWASLAELTNIELPSRANGQSFARAAGRDDTGTQSPIFADLEQRFRGDRQRHRRTMVTGQWKLVMDLDREAELFDLAKDPSESAPVSDAESERRRRMRTAQLDRDARAAAARAAIPTETHTIDPARQAQLEALGYLE